MPDTRYDVSVVMATFGRSGEYVRATGESLLEQCTGSYELLIVDQNIPPRDALREFAASTPTRVRHLTNRPPGLPGARNCGARHAQGNILLFVDDDVRPRADLVQRHRRHYDDPAIGGVAGQVIPEGESPIQEEVPVGRFRAWDASFQDNFQASRPTEVDSLFGCNMSLRREALARIGGFSLLFGGTAHLEETDVSLRLRRLGYRLLFDPEASLVHLRALQGGCRLPQPSIVYWYAHNYSLLFLSHFPLWGLPVFLAQRMVRVALFGLEARSLKVAASGLRGLADSLATYRHRSGDRGLRRPAWRGRNQKARPISDFGIRIADYPAGVLRYPKCAIRNWQKTWAKASKKSAQKTKLPRNSRTGGS